MARASTTPSKAGPKKIHARLNSDTWLDRSLKLLSKRGPGALTLDSLTKHLKVTTGSFYWHFKNRRELLHAVLEYWERETTDGAIEAARAFPGDPCDRILRLMEAVMADGLARYDLAISHWAQADVEAREVFQRVLEPRTVVVVAVKEIVL